MHNAYVKSIISLEIMSVRRIVIFLLSTSMRFTLFLGLSLLAVVIVLGNKQTLKDGLTAVNAYERFTSSIIDSAVENKTANVGEIPMDRPEVQKAIRNSLNEQSLEKISHSVIDSGYDWLSGDTATLNFEIKLTSNQQILAKGVSDYAANRLANLNPCTTQPTESNIFKIECNPPGVDLAQQRKEVYDAIMEDTSIFGDGTFTAKDLPRVDQGRTFEQTYNQLPGYYRLAKIAPYVLLGFSILSALLLIMIAHTKRNAFKMIGSSLFSSGLFLAITPLIYMYVLPLVGFSLPGTNGGSKDSIASISSNLVEYVYREFNATIINLSIQIAAAGAIIWMIVYFINKNPNPYNDIQKKSGIAVSGSSPSRTTKTKPDASKTSIPVQTSEASKSKRRKGTAVEKKFTKM